MPKLTYAVSGEAIKKLRAKRIITQSELARLVGLSEASIRKYEREGARVHGSTLIALALALKVDPSELRDGTDADERLSDAS